MANEILKKILNNLNKSGLDVKFASELEDVKYLKTGIPIFDYYVRIPYGKFTIAYGRPSSGKTTLALRLGAQVQKAGGNVAILDLENSYSADWARVNGLDPETTIVLKSEDTFEHGADSANNLLMQIKKYRESKEYKDSAEKFTIDLLIVDSIHAAATQAEIDKVDDKAKGSFTQEAQMANLAKKITLFIKKLTPIADKLGCCVFLIGQARDAFGYGGGIHLTGGNALKHSAWTIMKLTASESNKNRKTIEIDGKQATAWPVDILLEKSKSAHHKAKFTVWFNTLEGFDVTQSVIDLAKSFGIIKTGGAGWLEYKDQKIRSVEVLREMLKDDILLEELKVQVQEKLESNAPLETNSSEDGEVDG